MGDADMRILVITQYFWPESFRINDLVEGLVDRGHEVTVLTGQPNYPRGSFTEGYGWGGPFTQRYAGAQVIRAPLVPRGGGGSARLAINYLSFALFATLIGLLRCRGAFDAIFVFQTSPVTVGIPARVLSWLKRAPIVFWVQDLWPESLSATGAVTSPRALAVVGGLVRWIYRGCAVVLAQSQAFRPSLLAMGVPPENIVYYPNSAEPLYKPVARTDDADIPPLPQGFRVMFAGNLGAAQALGTILDAAERLRDEPAIQWIIVGDGRQRSWMEEEVRRRELGSRVHFMGSHPMATMPYWFAQADIMLATLTKDPIFAITIPSRIQSYLACAKPIIAAIDGEGARIVEEAGAGLGVPAEDPEALAGAVRTLLETSGDDLRRMGENGLNYFDRHFERRLLLDKLEDILADCSGVRR